MKSKDQGVQGMSRDQSWIQGKKEISRLSNLMTWHRGMKSKDQGVQGMSRDQSWIQGSGIRKLRQRVARPHCGGIRYRPHRVARPHYGGIRHRPHRAIPKTTRMSAPFMRPGSHDPTRRKISEMRLKMLVKLTLYAWCIRRKTPMGQTTSKASAS